MYNTLHICNKKYKISEKILDDTFMRYWKGSDWDSWLFLWRTVTFLFCRVLIPLKEDVDSEILERRGWWRGKGFIASKELVFVCETLVIALSVIFYLTGSSPCKCSPSMFHLRFSSHFIDPFFCSVTSHPAFVLLTFVTVFIFLMSIKLLKLFLCYTNK